MARKALHAAGNASGRKRDFEGHDPEAHRDADADAVDSLPAGKAELKLGPTAPEDLGLRPPTSHRHWPVSLNAPHRQSS